MHMIFGNTVKRSETLKEDCFKALPMYGQFGCPSWSPLTLMFIMTSNACHTPIGQPVSCTKVPALNQRHESVWDPASLSVWVVQPATDRLKNYFEIRLASKETGKPSVS